MAAAVLVSKGRYTTLEDALRKQKWYQGANVKQAALGLGGIAIFFVAWALFSYLGLISERFLPSPRAVAMSFAELVRSGALWGDVQTTLWRTLSGFALGSIAGVVVGFGMAMSRYIKAALYPLFAATFPLPKIALVPLSMVYLGTGNAPIVAVVAVSAFYLLPVNVMAAVSNIETIYRDVAEDLHVSRGMFWRTIAFPHALPMVLAALRSAWAISLIVVVAAEMLIAKAGIGYMIWHSSQLLAVEPVFCAFIVIGMLGYGSHLLFDWLSRLLTPWQTAP